MAARPGRLAAFLLLAPLLPAACLARPPEPLAPATLERAYRPASAPLATPRPTAVRAPLDLAMRIVADGLAGAGLDVRAVDPASGRIAAFLSGEAGPWLDCGSFVPAGAAEAQRLASTALLTRIVPPGGPPEVVALRQLRLDARMVVRGVQSGEVVALSARIAYLVTRTLDAIARDGRVLETRRETVIFEAGTTGRLDDHLVCRSNGRLEDLLDALVRRPAVAAADGR